MVYYYVRLSPFLAPSNTPYSLYSLLEGNSRLTQNSGFLSIATYLIFGSWLNYNRYGARGWDLLPHGDTIRDVPYLVKDWSRRVFNTVQDSGSRGGYSAV